MSDSSEIVLNAQEAAAYLGRSPGTLATWRHWGVGPPYLKVQPTLATPNANRGKRLVAYRMSDLKVWHAANRHLIQPYKHYRPMSDIEWQRIRTALGPGPWAEETLRRTFDAAMMDTRSRRGRWLQIDKLARSRKKTFPFPVPPDSAKGPPG